MTREIIPTAKRVLVRRIRPEKKGVLIVKEEVKNEGIIVAIGYQVEELEEGLRVLFDPYGGIPIKNDEKEELMLFEESQILAII
jgi:co-chaperonin GroES (HSP10)